MKRVIWRRFLPSALLALACVTLAFVASGCASTKSEDLSTRPWSTPQGWEGGLPPGMYDRQR